MKEKIIELRKQGKSYNEIKDILKCSKATISYHCSKLESNDEIKDLNLKIKNKKQVKEESFLLPEDEIIEKIIGLRKLKKTYKEISDLLNLSINKISKVCRKFDLIGKRYYGKLDDKTIERIKILYNDLKSLRKVAKIIGVSRDGIRYHVIIKEREKLGDEKLKENRVKSVVDWRVRTKQKLVDYKGGECCRCGYKKETKALTFHHLEPNKKDFNISGKSWSFERLKKEVDKCILLCANCHIEIHEELRKE
jgi:DNA-binding CsgD family transcriptional regulator